MRIGISSTTKYVDNYCSETLKIPLIVMMENAALKAYKHINKKEFKNYTIVCGVGNNGGDGLAIARHLIAQGKNVEVFLVGKIEKLSECSKINYQILKNMQIDINTIEDMNDNKDLNKLKMGINKSDLLVDAIFGTGLKREVIGVFKECINIINEYKNIYSIDVPSGINCDNGEVLGICVKANKTICFEFYKRGFFNYEVEKYLGEVVVENIGIPKDVLNKFDTQEYITNKEYIKNSMLKKDTYSFKSDYGKVLIIAGSDGFYGASYIATQAAVKSGSGLVTLVSDKEVLEKASIRLTEAMTCSFEDERLENLLDSCNAIGFGCGMGNNESTFEKLKYIIKKSKCPIVIDADGINVLENRYEEVFKLKKDIIITPHLGEMSRLTGLDIEYIRKNRIDVAKEFAKKHNIIVLLKGYETVITNGVLTYINPTGNHKMANGGMGDTLTGIITSFIGQGMKTIDSAICAAYIHGFIGDELSDKLYTVNATDIINSLQSCIEKFI
ncbi:bifunctional ADP-dependent NAD(P)H-hydrate dehydratase/NAD(P)H-hydrate epimerase [Paraclostridium sordellii]|uniref:bifunctional ADP-dependent NAD(P)H-hydrate dehydratase/NAD(P)H-hydrate epimerase n=1 Tax=Paraclostridium sordellii TaxID=1505 RepID=UPI0005E46553|nr:bifunctional ADP-dependent NAD(P)H-hydrate dehydratase/NAD(P)H-hydrate epimerase [Paeniclostridium sordellii]CEO26534.1 carbohydrate kinase [[Clostridium] sordellii] [Paeniclostridium sordellii]